MTAIGYVRKEEDGRYSGSIKTISIRADVEIIPNLSKTADAQPDYRVLTQGVEIAFGMEKDEHSRQRILGLVLVALASGPCMLYANLGRTTYLYD